MDATPQMVHPTAFVESGAQLGANVRIGPFCHVGPNVVLGDNVTLISHAVVIGDTRIGEGTTIHPNAVVGGDPQNTAYKGEATQLIVGRNTTIREGVTMHRGTGNSRGQTVIGDNCMFLAYAHVAHDCIIGDNVTFANNAMIGGHVTIHDRVILGGAAGVHQFCVIGEGAFIGGMTGIGHDVIPYAMAIGNRAHLVGLNLVGLKRAGMSRQDIHLLRGAFEVLFAENGRPLRENALALQQQHPDHAAVQKIVAFVLDDAKRQLTTPHSGKKNRRAEQE